MAAPMIVNRQGLASAMGVSAPTIDRWVREGCPIKKRGSKGVAAEYSIPDVIAWWSARERDRTTGENDDEEKLKLRKLAAETGRAELAFARESGEVALVLEFERAQAKMMAAIRANVMNVPARAVLQLLGETDETTFKTRLRAELTLALEQSAEVDFDIEDEDMDAAEGGDE